MRESLRDEESVQAAMQYAWERLGMGDGEVRSLQGSVGREDYSVMCRKVYLLVKGKEYDPEFWPQVSAPSACPRLHCVGRVFRVRRTCAAPPHMRTHQSWLQLPHRQRRAACAGLPCLGRGRLEDRCAREGCP